MTEIKEHMEVIGADGVHVGTVDKVEGNRIKLTKKDSGEGSHMAHHPYIDRALVAHVERNKGGLPPLGGALHAENGGPLRQTNSPPPASYDNLRWCLVCITTGGISHAATFNGPCCADTPRVTHDRRFTRSGRGVLLRSLR